MLGDSHTAALGPRVKSRLAEKGHSLTFESFSGHSTKRAHEKATIPSGVDAVILSLGGNDFGTQKAARDALVAAVKKKNPNASILWAGPAYSTDKEVGPRHDQQAEAQRSTLPSLGVQWYDSRAVTRTGHGPDGVHFKPEAYSAWASQITAKALDLDVTPRPGPVPAPGVERISLGLTIAVGLYLAYRMLSRER
jgi:lysophospholipase L1-like esterase